MRCHAGRLLVGTAVMLTLLAASGCGGRPGGSGSGPNGEPTCRGRTAASWVEQLLAAEDDATYEEALDALIDLAVDHETCPFDEAVEELTRALASDDACSRYAAAIGLGMFERRALTAVDLLIAVVSRDDDPEVRERAAWAIGQIAAPPRAYAIALFGAEHVKPAPPEPDPALARRAERAGLEALTKALRDDDPEVRKTALGAIPHWGAHARVVAQRVAGFLTDPDSGTRYKALLAVGTIGAPAEMVVHRVTRLLTERSPYTRRAAAMRLKAFGPDAVSAVPALEEMARDPEVREAAEEALEAIRGHVEERPFEPAVPDLPPGAG